MALTIAADTIACMCSDFGRPWLLLKVLLISPGVAIVSRGIQSACNFEDCAFGESPGDELIPFGESMRNFDRRRDNLATQG